MRTDPPSHRSVGEPWVSFLRDIDDALGGSVAIHCVGGFALTVFVGDVRPTGDIDFIEACPEAGADQLIALAGAGTPLATKHGLYLQEVGVADAPCDYEQRLVDATPDGLSNLKILVLEPHDLFLTKIQRNSPKDREDVRALAKGCALEPGTLRKRFEAELKPYLAVAPDRTILTFELWMEEFFGESR